MSVVYTLISLDVLRDTLCILVALTFPIMHASRRRNNRELADFAQNSHYWTRFG